MAESGIAVAGTARLSRHSSSRVTGTIYRHALCPAIATGVGVTDKIFIYRMLPCAIYNRTGTLCHEPFPRE